MKKKVLLISIFLVFIAEVSLKLFFSKDLDFVGTPLVYQFDSVVNYSYIPSSKFTRKGEDIFINKQGFIGNDFSVRDSNSFRIVVIGCSSVSGPNHLLEYHSFPPIIEKKFKENHYKVEVLNCGVDGFGRSVQLLQSIPYQILAFDPDLVLFECDLPMHNSNISREAYRGVNIFYPCDNIESREDVKTYVDDFLKYRGFIHILHSSYIMRVAIKLYMKLDFQNYATYYIRAYQSNCWHSWGNEQLAITMEESIYLIQQIKENLLSRNISFFLFQYHKELDIIQVAKQHNLPLISLDIDFTPEDYYYKDGHWNGNGCEKIAEKFFRLFYKYKLIPPKYHSDLIT